MDTLAIIKRIELRLAELRLSKAEFYERSGISSASYSQWNTGKYNPSITKLRQAAEVLGLDFDYLCDGCSQKEKAPTPEGERLFEDKNVLRIAGRDGSYMVKVLTDEQMKAVMTMVDHLPDAYEDL